MIETIQQSIPDRNFWKNKKVLITGITGFKGSWLSIYLDFLGAIVYGYSLNPPTNPSLYQICRIDELTQTEIGDIRDLSHLREVINRIRPEIVIHFAAQALVRESYINPVFTFETNVIGTVNILEAARHCPSIKVVIVATTDKVYQNKEWLWGYRENDPLGGFDPYSGSKACAEFVTKSYRNSYFSGKEDSLNFMGISSVRAGNVIGGGDWAKDRIIPDFFRALEGNKPLIIRYPGSIRPWQHVFEPLRGYLLLSERIFEQGRPFCDSWNFGSDEKDHKTVKWIIDYLSEHIGSEFDYQIEENTGFHETTYLRLDCSKAKQLLNWYPNFNITSSLDNVIAWYEYYKNNEDMQKICQGMLEKYHKVF